MPAIASDPIPVEPLSPVMTSRPLQMLDWVTRYIGRHVVGPARGEVAEALGVSPTRVRQLEAILVGRGLLLRGPLRGGQRTLVLPSAHAAAIALLRAEGWRVDLDAHVLSPPCQDRGIPLMPPLIYDLPGRGEEA